MRKISKNVKVLGSVSFFTDVSSEMILPVLPLFLINVLGARKSHLGLIEGVAEFTSSLSKVFSGWYSDRIKKRKPFVLIGYGLSNFIKPVFAVTGSWIQVLLIRFVDRTGKGIRTAPRDALIAEVSPEDTRGGAFGLHRSMDTLGAVVGGAVAFFLLRVFPENFRLIFALSLIPGLTAFIIAVKFVREGERRGPLDSQKLTMGFSGSFYYFIAVMFIFTFANPSYAFVILRLSEMSITTAFIPLIYIWFNVIYSIAAYPAGIISDRWGRSLTLSVGILLMAIMLFGFAKGGGVIEAILLSALYGVVIAIWETVSRTYVAELVPIEKIGTAMGIYHTAIGIAFFPANLLFGWLWDLFRAPFAFNVAAIIAVISFLMIQIKR
ncbi:MAG: MFS transporter [Fidelibacterota bacterium]